jgi:hypothetical protein
MSLSQALRPKVFAILTGGQSDELTEALGRLTDGIISAANATSGDCPGGTAANFVCRNATGSSMTGSPRKPDRTPLLAGAREYGDFQRNLKEAEMILSARQRWSPSPGQPRQKPDDNYFAIKRQQTRSNR